MKKIILILLCFLLIPTVYAEEISLGKNATAVVLIDNATGTILYEKNKDEKLAVASMTKMVAQIIILENIEKGNLSWEDEVTASINAAGMGGSQIWLQPNEKMTVKDLMKGITMASANDATVALAERIAGTETAFVELMNQKVKDLGLNNTHFVNSTGLDEKNHYSSAWDMAMIAKELLRHEQILEFSSLYEDYLRDGQFWLVNTNKLVRFYSGADGLKTGFTDAAKYCMAVTAKRGDMRLIAIVLGENVGKVRNQETMELLDYGFNSYKINVIKRKDEIIKTIDIDKGTKDKVDIVLAKDATILEKKSDQSLAYDTEIKIEDISLPLKKGQIVGKLSIKKNDTIIDNIDLVIKQDVQKTNWLTYFYQTFIEFLTFSFFK